MTDDTMTKNRPAAQDKTTRTRLRPFRFGSVCSGIDAASVAWTARHGGPMDWTCEFFSEIEPFPSAVLAHHYGSNMPGEEHSQNGIPNYGDMTKFQEWPDHGENSARPIDLLIGGTPCQDYSIAGLRAGMAGDRGSLTLTFIELAARYRPRWVLWENVPGVLSSNGGKDFARFLGDISGTVVKVPKGGWRNSGIITGCHPDAYGVAYRVLDAQYVRVDGMERAVPQRRRRVFVVGCLGSWQGSAAVLFEPESLRGHTAPRRRSRQDLAADARRGFTASSFGQYSEGCGTIRAEGGDLGGGSETIVTQPQSCVDVADTLSVGANQTTGFESEVVASTGDVAHCLNAGGMGRQDSETETIISHTAPVASTLNARFGKDEGIDNQHIDNGAPLFVIDDGREIEKKQNELGISKDEVDYTLDTLGAHAVCFNARQDPEVTGDRAGSLDTGSPQSQAVAYATSEHGLSETTMSLTRSYGAGGADLATKPLVLEGHPQKAPPIYPINSQIATRHKAQGEGTGLGIGLEGNEPSYTLQAGQKHAVAAPAVAFHENQKAEVHLSDTAYPLSVGGGKPGQGYPAVMNPEYGRNIKPDKVTVHYAVRKLTEIECARLQGFPDKFTLIEWRGKPADQCPSGPQYKCFGNSMAVNVIRWLGQRMQEVDSIIIERAAA